MNKSLLAVLTCLALSLPCHGANTNAPVSAPETITTSPAGAATASTASNVESVLQSFIDQALNGGTNWTIAPYFCLTQHAPKGEHDGGGLAIAVPMYTNNGFGAFAGARVEYFEHSIVQISVNGSVSDRFNPIKPWSRLWVEVFGGAGVGNLHGSTFADTFEGGAVYYTFSKTFDLGIIGTREQRSGSNLGGIGYSYCLGPEGTIRF